MGAIASQTTSLMIVYSIVYSDADQRKHQSSASLAFVRFIHRGPVVSPHKWPVTRKMFPFDDVIMGVITKQLLSCLVFPQLATLRSGTLTKPRRKLSRPVDSRSWLAKVWVLFNNIYSSRKKMAYILQIICWNAFFLTERVCILIEIFND